MKKLLGIVAIVVLFFGCSQKEVVVKKKEVENLQSAPAWVKRDIYKDGYLFAKSFSQSGSFDKKRDEAFFASREKLLAKIDAKLQTFFQKHDIEDVDMRKKILKDIQKEISLYDLYESNLKKVYVLAYIKKDTLKKTIDKHFGKIKNSTYSIYITAKKNGELESLF